MPSIIGKATSTFSLSSMKKKKTDDDLQVEFLLLPLNGKSEKLSFLMLDQNLRKISFL